MLTDFKYVDDEGKLLPGYVCGGCIFNERAGSIFIEQARCLNCDPNDTEHYCHQRCREREQNIRQAIEQGPSLATDPRGPTPEQVYDAV